VTFTWKIHFSHYWGFSPTSHSGR